MIFHPEVRGRAVSFPIKCHAEGDDVSKGALADIRRVFDLPADIY